jgi:DNA invertase Pin-like site-specific DNA recombinase
VTDRLYLRHSTDSQTDARQRHALDRLIKAGAPIYLDPATSTRVLALNRPGFKRLLDEAAVNDTIRIADAARLFRSVADVLGIRPVLIRRGLHLRVESGLLSGIDLAGDDPGTKMVVSILAAVLEFQRDLISENTKEGVAAAEAAGKNLGRPAALDDKKAADVVTAFHEGAAVKALARRFGTSPRTIRRALDAVGARELPGDLVALADPDAAPDAADDQEAAPEVRVTADVPGLLADHLRSTGDEGIRRAVISGRIIRRGQGYSVRLTALPAVHRALLEHCAPLAGAEATPAARKAYRTYADRLTTTGITPGQEPRWT